MGFGFRKSWQLGWKYLHIKVNASKTGASWSWKVGPLGWNARYSQFSLDLPGPFFWRGRRYKARR